MKIIKLVASNFKGIKAICVEPKNPLVKVEGLNGNGKSSVLDCIESAIRGGRFAPSQPVRIGEKKGEIELTLSDENGKAKLIVTRTFKEGSNVLRVTDANGRKFPSPQSMLDTLADGLAFDPMDFFNLVGLAKVEMLKRALGLDFINEDNEIERISGLRTIAFQRKRGSEHAAKKFIGIEKINVPNIDDIKKERLDAVEINNGIYDEKKKIDELCRYKEAQADKLIGLRKKYAERNERIKLLKDEIEGLEVENIEAKDSAEKLKVENENLYVEMKVKNKSYAEKSLVDLSEFDEKINDHADLSVKAERYKLKLDAESEVEKFANEWGELDGQINDIRDQKKAKIAATTMPVQGMSFEDETISIDGVDIAQVNTSIQIETSLKIAMALNPKLKVIRIKSGSLLDDKSIMRIEEIAEKEDFQIWMEKIESEKTSSDSFFISEGTLQ